MTDSLSLNEIQPGDVLMYWHDNGVGGDIGYRRVIRVNRKTVTVETKYGERYRAPLSNYFKKAGPNEWTPWNQEGN